MAQEFKNLHTEDLDLVEIGTIVAPQGLKGEVRVKTSSDFPERFEQAGIRWVQTHFNQSPTEIELLRGKQLPGKNIFVVKLSGIDDRNQAESLRGSILYADKNDRPALAEEEYHVADLIGLEVYHQQTGENIGFICDVFSAGNDVLEVQLHRQPEFNHPEIEQDVSKIDRISKQKKVRRRIKKKNKLVTILIPFVSEIVPIVNLTENMIHINPPDGLLNLDTVEEA